MFQISQAKNFIKNPDISPICGFFQHFLALFDTFTSRYNHSYIKFEFSGYFYPYKHFLKKNFLENELKMPFQPLWAGWALAPPEIGGFRKEDRIKYRQSITFSPLRFVNLMTYLHYRPHFPCFH